MGKCQQQVAFHLHAFQQLQWRLIFIKPKHFQISAVCCLIPGVIKKFCDFNNVTNFLSRIPIYNACGVSYLLLNFRFMFIQRLIKKDNLVAVRMNKVQINLIVVVLPAPFLPINPVIFPASKEKVTLFNLKEGYSLTRFRTITILINSPP